LNILKAWSHLAREMSRAIQKPLKELKEKEGKIAKDERIMIVLNAFFKFSFHLA